MKIAILGTKGVPGRHGVEVVVDSLLPYLSEMGHEVTVYGYGTYTENIDDYRGGRVKTVSGSSKTNFEMISHMWKATTDANRHDYDIVHIHSTDPCLLAWLPKARYGVVATSHGQAYLRKKWGFISRNMSKLAERFFIRIPKAITSVSEPLSDYYQAKYKKYVQFIPNGITFRNTPNESFLSKWNLTSKQFFFCSAGRIEQTKGLHTLLNAYSKLNTDVPLVIAGGGRGTDFTYFKTLIADKPEGVLFAGFLTGDELYALYAHARVFVFPSEYEAMSMALLEGLSFGVPTVYSDIPENSTVAEGLGFSFKVSDADSLSAQLEIVLANYVAAAERAKIAMKKVKEHHDWATIAKQYNGIYFRLKN